MRKSSVLGLRRVSSWMEAAAEAVEVEVEAEAGAEAGAEETAVEAEAEAQEERQSEDREEREACCLMEGFLLSITPKMSSDRFCRVV